MTKKALKSGDLKTLHSMSEFGVVSELTHLIRVNALNERLVPSVPFPHKHDFYQIMIVTEGRGWHEIDFERFPVKAGSVFAMKPVQVHSWQLDRNAKGFLIEFNSLSLFSNDEAFSTLKRIIDEIPGLLQLNARAQKRVFALVAGMLSDFDERGPEFETSLRASLTLLFTLLYRESKMRLDTISKVDPFFSRFQTLVESNFRKHHDVAFYAAALNISVKVCTMRISRLAGESPRHFIQNRALLEGKRLLAYSTMSVSEIAYALGFEDPNYFARFFKSKTKITPGGFRTKVRKT